MDREMGLARLRKYLAKSADGVALSQLDLLEEQLRSSIARLDLYPNDDAALITRNQALIELDRLSWRTLGIPFADIYRPPPKLGTRLPLSIRGLMVLVLAVLLLPAVSIAAATAAVQQHELQQISEIQKEIQQIDGRINRDVSAPYYLSPVPEDPCNRSTLERLVTWDDFTISIHYPAIRSVVCVWEYSEVDSGELIARDYWGEFSRPLAIREYYRNDNAIARDEFNIDSFNCVKKRSYFQTGIRTECYSETGMLLSVDPRQKSISPIPPMVYWFFYR